MGEAKFRKSNDDLFGKVPKNSRTRGIIISSPLSLDLASRSSRIQGGLDPLELRFSLLYWDKLLFPMSPAVSIDGGDDCDFLMSAGVMSRPIYGENSGEMTYLLWSTFINAFTDCENKEPGVWSLAQGENSLFIKNSANVFLDNSGISINLTRAVPTPAADIPLAEILEFKERRKDELLVFRTHIDKLTDEIQNSDQKTERFNQMVKEIDSACADLLKVGKEWQYPLHISDFKASINLNGFKTVTAAGAGWKLAEPYGLAAAGVVAAAAGIASSLDIKADMGLRSIKRPLSPFRYVARVHNELL